MIESVHAGQDANVHGPSASMIESIHAGQVITFMSLVHPCSRKLSTNVSFLGQVHDLPNKAYKTKALYSTVFLRFHNVQNIRAAGQPLTLLFFPRTGTCDSWCAVLTVPMVR